MPNKAPAARRDLRGAPCGITKIEVNRTGVFAKPGPDRIFGTAKQCFARERPKDPTNGVCTREPAHRQVETSLEVVPKDARMEGPRLEMIFDRQRDVRDAVSAWSVEELR